MEWTDADRAAESSTKETTRGGPHMVGRFHRRTVLDLPIDPATRSGSLLALVLHP
ncbi:MULTISPECIES: hypothetical protein [Prauserella salsuginis group]|uniref:Uncharacterized protein n=1 Tax=Prauserella salsuginis TaxID=387889 RepID=A0ABW6FWU8_9PSEU|nr:MULTISPECIES: hypothetical protein [Prauserella salsuginis group]